MVTWYADHRTPSVVEQINTCPCRPCHQQQCLRHGDRSRPTATVSPRLNQRANSEGPCVQNATRRSTGQLPTRTPPALLTHRVTFTTSGEVVHGALDNLGEPCERALAFCPRSAPDITASLQLPMKPKLAGSHRLAARKGRSASPLEAEPNPLKLSCRTRPLARLRILYATLAYFKAPASGTSCKRPSSPPSPCCCATLTIWATKSARAVLSN